MLHSGGLALLVFGVGISTPLSGISPTLSGISPSIYNAYLILDRVFAYIQNNIIDIKRE